MNLPEGRSQVFLLAGGGQWFRAILCKFLKALPGGYQQLELTDTLQYARKYETETAIFPWKSSNVTSQSFKK